MKSALLEFREGINQLRIFFDRNLAEQEFISLLNDPGRAEALREAEKLLLKRLVQASINTRQYIYIVSIVSMYGLLERLVDNFVERFALHLNSIYQSFNKLPDVVQKNHLPLSVALIDAVGKDKFRVDLSPESIVANLHSCLSGSKNYALNVGAFSLHRGNLNLDRIEKNLSSVGVNNHLRRIIKTDSLKSLSSRIMPEMSEEDVRKLFVCIDELVGRRNEVSHGVVDDLESIDLLMTRCSFVEEYGAALFNVLDQEVIKHKAENGLAFNMGRQVAVHNNEIVCFHANFDIEVGDRLVTLTRDALAPVRTSAVISLQVQHKDVQKVDKDPRTLFGAKVSFHAQKDVEYFLLKS